MTTKRAGISAAAFWASYSNPIAPSSASPPEPNHKSDADCAGHMDADGNCAVCGVWHGPECPECGERGYHLEHCPESDSDREQAIVAEVVGPRVLPLTRMEQQQAMVDAGCDTLAEKDGER